MKKLLAVVSILMVILGTVLSVNAYETASVTLNGQYIQFDQQPIIINDRTMVPMRKIFEAMGCEVLWDEEDEMIDVWRGDDNLMTLWIGDLEMWTPGGLVYLDAAPFVMNDRTLVPVRAISESIGAQVDWDEYNWTVIITYNGSSGSISYVGCPHNNLRSCTNADSITYINTGSPTEHTYRRYVTYTCEDCGTEVYSQYEEDPSSHHFNGNVCTICGYTKTGNTSSGNCAHTSTRQSISIDEREYTNTSDPEKHFYIDKLVTWCNYCGEEIDVSYLNSEDEHRFDGNICVDCGYTKGAASSGGYSSSGGGSSSGGSAAQRPSSSGSVSDYIDGAFMNVTVPAGTSICVPNTSGSTLNLKMDGVYNAFEREADGDIDTQPYNQKDKSGSITISKGAEAIIENSGNGDLIVSIPSEYAEYSVTYEKVYETVLLSRGESVKLESINDQSAYYYANNSDYRIIKYDPGKNSISTTALDASSSKGSVGKGNAALITANSSVELHYCPALLSCTRSASGFREMTLSNGDTIRLTASSSSKMVIYTEGGQEYDYVEYNSKGTAGTPKKGIKTKSQTINKGCYADFTNTSGRSMTVYVTDLYGSVEYR